jgi:hypothetical protein
MKETKEYLEFLEEIQSKNNNSIDISFPEDMMLKIFYFIISYDIIVIIK